MSFECCKQNFRFINVDKSEIERETEYELPEYKTNIHKILTSNSEIKIDEKEFRNGEICISGEIIWKILYVSQPDNKIKNLTFFEDFERQIPVKDPCYNENGDAKIFIRAFPVSFSTKLNGQRKIFARSKFLVICDVVQREVSEKHEENSEILPEIQIKKKQLKCSDIEYSEKENIDISMEINIDSEMPEIREIISSHSTICINEMIKRENSVLLKCELCLSCLYEAETEQAADYVSYQKSVPFEREIYTDAESYSAIYPEYEVKRMSVSAENDDYSERRIIKVSADLDLVIACVFNKECIAITDIYSTEYPVIPEKKPIDIFDFLGIYDCDISVQERVRTDLRGITDILYSSADLVFSLPLFDSEQVYMNAKGVLRIIGVKENGEPEGISVNISLKIPMPDIPLAWKDKKIIWNNRISLMSYDCKILNGEITFSAFVCGRAAAFEQTIHDAVIGFSKTEGTPLNHDGFTLYYPESGESVWAVAKNHMVNIERFVAENNITGEFFDGKTAVLLH